MRPFIGALGTRHSRRGRSGLTRAAVSALFSLLLLAAFVAVPVIPAITKPAAAAAQPASPANSVNTPSVSTTIPAGSYIIDMGVTPQTVANGLLPYGLIYALMIQQMVPVEWVINDSKATDGVDFTYNGKNYSGGAFIVDAQYAQQAAATIATFKAKGVVVDGPTTSAFQAPVYKTLTNWPNAILDAQNGKIAQAFYTSAGIPQSVTNAATGKPKVAYQFLSPLDPGFLSGCYDIYVMPHADPTYATHHTLADFNEQGGYIWAGCHAVSVMEGIRNPTTGDLALNFLSSNGLVPFGSHKGPTAPFSRTTNGGDPVNQYLGSAYPAQLNGSEEVYLPAAGSSWNPDTHIIEANPGHAQVPSLSPGPAIMSIYGRGFGNPDNGLVMYQAGHNLAGSGAVANQVAAIRSFLNFNLLAGIERGLDVTVDAPPTIVGGATQPVSATISGGATNYTYQWVSSCGGSFDTPTGSVTRSGDSVTVNANFTAPAQAQNCSIKLSVSDSCGRNSFGTDTTIVVEVADLSITKVDRASALESGSDDTYTIVVTNKGPGTANPVTLMDIWPRTFTTFVSATASQGSCTFNGTRVDCDIGSIPAGGSVTITLNGRVLPDAHGTITNSATVSAPQQDPNPGDNTASDTTDVAPNGLRLEKTADPSSVAPADNGGNPVPVTFTFAVTNTGPNDLSNVHITDSDVPGCDNPSLQSGDSNGDRVLQPSERWIFTCTVPIGQDTHNVATASAVDPVIGPVTATDDATVNAIAPGITIDKGVDGKVNSAGGDVVFNITVTNSGDTVLNDVQVTDSSTPDCERFLGTMQPGDVITYACSISPAPAAGTSDRNVASVAGTPPGGTQVTDSDPAPYSVVDRAMSITKTPVDCASHDPLNSPAYYPGDQVCYQIQSTNTSDTPQTNVTLTDNLPPGLTHNRTDWSTSVTQAEQELVNENFDANATLSGNNWANGVVEINNDTNRNGGDVRVANSATTDTGGSNPAGCTAANLTDPHGCTVLARGDRGIAVPVPGNLSSYGQCTLDFDYKIVNVDNSGGDTGVGIQIGGSTTNAGNYNTTFTPVETIAETTTTDWIHHTTTLTGSALNNIVIGVRGRGSNNGDRYLVDNFVLTCGTNHSDHGTTTNHPTIISAADGITLDPQQTLTAYVQTTMTDAGGMFPRELTNVAGISSTEQPDPSEATATVQRVETGIHLTKQASAANVAPGATVTYTFTVTNTGNDPLSGVSVTDANAPGCQPELQSGDANHDGHLDPTETWVFTCQATITQDTHNVATVEGTATTHSVDPNSTALPTVTDTASADVNVVRSGIHIVKSVNNQVIRPGNPVTYSYAVTLPDGITEPLTAVFVTDDQCSNIQGPTKTGGNQDQTLEPGETWTYTCQTSLSTTTQNTATAHGTDRLGTDVTDTDTQTVRVINPAIAVTKSASPTQISPGDQVTFTMQVTNPGNDPLSNVTLSDSRCSPVTLVGGDNGDHVLQPDETWTYQCTMAVNADETNVATVTGTDSLGGAVRASATAHVDVVAPSVDLVKFADKSLIRPGDTVTYTIVAINNGDLPLSGAQVTDDTCPTLEGPFTDSNFDTQATGDLATGSRWFYRCSTTLDKTTNNTADFTATAQPPTGPPVDVTGTANALVRVYNPVLQVTKAADQTKVEPGTPVTYTFTVKNATPCAADDITCLQDNEIPAVDVTDSHCDNVEPVLDDQGFNVGDSGGIGEDGAHDLTLDVGETWKYTCTTPVNSPTTNTVTVVGHDTLGQTVGPETATAHVGVSVAPTLSVVKSGPTTAPVGDTVTYTYEVSNTTNCDVAPDPNWCRQNSFVSDPQISDNVTGTPTYVSGDENDNGLIDVGETWHYQATHTATEADLLAGGVDNTVTVSGTDRDGGTVGPVTDHHHLAVTSNPALTVDKQAGTPSGATAGSTIDYTYLVTNSGNVTLTGVVVNDPNVPDVTCVVTTLAPGQQTTCMGTYTITQTDVDMGSVSNRATASGNPPGAQTPPVTSPPDSTEVAIQAGPDLSIEKTAGQPTGASAGATIAYTFKVTNTGNVTLTGVAVNDSKVGAVTCPQTTLAPGAETTCTATYTITQDDVNAGAVDNLARATGQPPSGPSVESPPGSTHTPLTRTPALTVDKQAGAPTGNSVGDTIDYTFVVTNTGNVTLTGIVVNDSKVRTVTCPDTTLAPGDSTTCTATYTITLADVDSGSVANTATATGDSPTGPVTSPPDETDTPVAPAPSLSIHKSAGQPSGASAGQTIHYTFTVTNTGNVTLTGIVVNDQTVGPVTCDDTSLAPGDSTACEATYTITQGDVDAGAVKNSATSTGNPPTGPPVTSEPSTTDTPLTATPALTVDKRAGDPSGASAGSTIDYTFTVTNTGNVTLTGIVVNDPKIGKVGCPTTSLAPGESTDCAATYTITQEDVDSGSVENSATTTGTPPSGPSVTSPPDTTDTPIDPSPSLTVVKRAGTPSGNKAGDTIAYTFVVHNTGNVTLSQIVVNDEKVGPVSCPETRLAPDASTTCTATYTITQADVDAGTVDNTATATGDPPSGPPVDSPEDSAQTPIQPGAALSLQKTAGDPSGNSAGDTIAYTFLVTNTGNLTLTDIVVHDSKVGTVTCPQTTLAPDASTTCTATYEITQDDVDGGAATNSATATGDPLIGPSVESPPDTTRTPLRPAPSLSVDKQAGTPSGTTAGSTIDYTFVVTNTGNVTLTHIVVNDPKVGEVACPHTTLIPGESTTCAATYTVTLADVDAGSVANTATVTGQPPSGPPVDSPEDSTDTPIVSGPALSIQKTAGEPSGASAGDTIDYTFVVTNTGNVTLHDIVVNDSKAGPVTCPETSLAPQASTTCTATYTITQADVDAATVHNTATATGQPPTGPPTTSPPDDTHTSIASAPGLSLEKNAAAPSGNTAGDTIDYTFDVTNTGNVTLHDIAVNDPKVGPVTCPTTPLAPGDSTRCTATYTITQADVDAATVTNTATATGSPPTGEPATSQPDGTVTPLEPGPAITMEKKAAEPTGTSAGDTIDYTFTVTNTGNVSLGDVAVDDSKLGKVTCPQATLAPNQSTECTATYEITQADVDAGTVTNTATASGNPPGFDTPPVTSLPDGTVTPLPATPHLTIRKTAGAPTGAAAGDTIDYTFEVTNTGNVTLTDIVVNDPKVGPVTCVATTLAPDKATTCTATYTITQEDVDAGTVDNTATATGQPPTGPPVDSGPGTTETPLAPAPSLAVDKQAGTPSGDSAGSTIAYTYVVTNTGNVTLTGIVVNDPKVGEVLCPETTLAPAATTTCTATYTLTLADVDSGSVANSATVTGHPPTGPPVTSPPDDTETPILPEAALTIDKSAGQPTGHTAGDTIDYTFVVTNTGNVTLTNIVVTDPKVGEVTCHATTLAPDATTRCTATYTLTQADVDAGNVSNTATSTGTPPAAPPVTSPPDSTQTPIDQAAALTIDKQAGPASGATSGSTIDYTFVVRNSGNVTLTDIVVNDPKVGAAMCATTELAPGNETTCTATYTITQEDVDSGSVENRATASGNPPGAETPPVDSPPDGTQTPIEPGPGLSIAKTAGQPTGHAAGDTIDYSFEVTNTGNVSLTDVVVNDPKVGTVTCEATSLAPGDHTTCTGRYTLTQADVDAGAVSNTATATGSPPTGEPVDSPPGSTQTPLAPDPALSIDKTAGEPTGNNAGSTIDYTFTVTNNGNVTLTGVVVNDPKIGAVTCPQTTLAPGASTTCRTTYTITQADVDAGTVTNTATATGQPPSGQPVDSPPDGTQTLLEPGPALTIDKSAGPPSGAKAGDTIDYTFRVTNAGNVTLHNVVVNDSKVGEVTCEATSLAPGASTTCSATYKITQADVDAGAVDNTATATGTPPTGQPVDSPPDSTQTTIDPDPALTVDKQAGTPSGNRVGDTITYTFVAKNAGNVTLTGIVVNDPKVGAAPCESTSLAPGASTRCTASYTLTQGDVDAGTVANTATVTGSPPTGPPVDSPPDGTETPIPPAPTLTIVKTAAAPTGQSAGDTIAYTFLVTNTGNVTLTEIVVNDPKVGEVTCPETTLAPGASTTCRATYTITQADVDAGTIDNVARATGTPPSGEPPLSPPSTTHTPLTPSPALTIRKVAGAPSGNGAGDTIHYTFTVTNTGNVTLTGIVVTDPRVGLVTCEETSLAPDASTQCSATYTLTQTDVDAGTVNNRATSTGTPPSGQPVDSPPDTTQTPIPPHAALTIDKQAGPPSGDTAGSMILYTFVVTNTGNVTLAHVVVNDPKVGAATCATTSLAPGVQTTCTATYDITQDDVDAGSVFNTATASGNPPGAETPPVTSPEDSTDTPIQAGPGLSIEKSAGQPSGHGVGATIDYTFKVTNTGNVTLHNVGVTDDKVGAVTCPETTLHPGDSTSCTATYTLTQADVDAGRVDNVATGTGTPPTGPSMDSPPSTTHTDIPSAPALTIRKTAGEPSGDNAGGTIDYTFLVTNTGNVTLTRIVVSDPKVGPVTCPDTTLAPGDSTTCRATYTISQADVDAGMVDNTATASGLPPSGPSVPSEPDRTHTPLEQTATLTIAKHAGSPTGTTAGSTISYRFEVTNTGNVTLTGIVITDAKVGAVTCNATSLPPGVTTECSATYEITQADIDSGSVSNTATATGTPPSGQPVDSPPDDTATTLPPAPGLSIEKSAGQPSGHTAGETIEYTFNVKNTGNVTLHSVVVEDPKVGPVACEATRLAPDASTTCHATYTITQEDVDAGTVNNTAIGRGSPPTGQPVDSPPGSTQTPIDQAPALTVDKSPGTPSGATAGSTIEYTYVVTNTGNVTLHDVTVNDPKVPVVTCDATELAPGEQATCTGTYAITQDEVDSGSVTNTATADGTPPGTQTPVTSPPDDTAITIEAAPALTVDKQAGTASVSKVGDTIDYTFTVTNAGNVTISGIVVHDPKVGAVTCQETTLAPGASTSCTATYTLTTSDVDSGSVMNTATATGNAPGVEPPTVTSPPDDTDTPIPPAPSLTVTKLAGTPSGTTAGSTIDYTFGVTNTGNVTLRDIVVNDPKVGQVSCPETTLGPGISTTCTATYTITQADVDAGKVANSATATGTPPVGEPVPSEPSTTDTPIEAQPALTIEKSAGAPSGPDAGATIDYTFKVTNTGNVTLDHITVNDDKVEGDVTCVATMLAPQESTTCEGTHAITQQEIDSQTLRNTATADGTPPTGPPVTSPPGHTEIPLPFEPSLSLEKKAAPTGAKAGDTIDYTFTVTNTGNVDLSGIRVHDPKIGDVTCDPTALAPDEQAQCTGRYTITQDDVDAGVVRNTATATGQPPAGRRVRATDHAYARLTPGPALTVEKSAGTPSGDNAGDTIPYTFTVTNTGNVTLHDVAVNDSKIGAVACQDTTLAVDATTTCTGNYTITQADVDAGTVDNSATASGSPPTGQPATSPPDSTQTPLTRSPALTVDKRAGTPSGTTVGSTIAYSFVVTNTGNVTLTQIAVQDTRVGAVTCPATTLPPGRSTTCTATYTMTQADVNAGGVSNTARASGNPPGAQTPPITSPPDSTHTPVEPRPSILLQKSVNRPSGVVAGEDVVFTFVVTNTGNVVLHGVGVNDPTVGPITCPSTTLVPGQSTTCTAPERTVAAADVNSGMIVNTAHATANQCTPAQIAAGRCDHSDVTHTASATIEVGQPAPPTPPPPPPPSILTLPNTGARIGLGLLAAAVALVLVGSGMVIFGSRRRRREDRNESADGS